MLCIEPRSSQSSGSFLESSDHRIPSSCCPFKCSLQLQAASVARISCLWLLPLDPVWPPPRLSLSLSEIGSFRQSQTSGDKSCLSRAQTDSDGIMSLWVACLPRPALLALRKNNRCTVTTQSLARNSVGHVGAFLKTLSGLGISTLRGFACVHAWLGPSRCLLFSCCVCVSLPTMCGYTWKAPKRHWATCTALFHEMKKIWKFIACLCFMAWHISLRTEQVTHTFSPHAILAWSECQARPSPTLISHKIRRRFTSKKGENDVQLPTFDLKVWEEESEEEKEEEEEEEEGEEG